jgi:hypothetical protein
MHPSLKGGVRAGLQGVALVDCIFVFSSAAIGLSYLFGAHPDPNNPSLVTDLEVAAACNGAAFLLFFPFGALIGRHRSRRAARHLTAWQELLPDEQYGPLEPCAGFRALKPFSEDNGDQLHLRVRPVEWNAETGCWDVAAGKVPAELAAQVIPHDSGLADAAQAWFDFCLAVGKVNALHYRAQLELERTQPQRDAIEQERAEQEAAAEQLALEQAQQEAERQRDRALAPHLPPAGTIIKGLETLQSKSLT